MRKQCDFVDLYIGWRLPLISDKPGDDSISSGMPKIRPNRLLAIDPSTKALGWACFIEQRPGRWALNASGVMRQRNDDGPDDEPAWLMNLDEVVEKVRELGVVDRVVIEQPQMFGSSRGKAAAASGSVLKLTAVAFALRQLFVDRGVPVMMVPVSRWKGQTPKRITQMRVRRVWAWGGDDHNEADAVGIGDWYLRKGPKAG